MLANRHLSVLIVLFREGNGQKHAMRDHNPFSASGTATFPTHNFVFTKPDDENNVLKRFVVGTYPDNLYAYDPYYVEGDPAATEANLKKHLNKMKIMIING